MTIEISKELFCRMFISLIDLRMFIETQPSPVLWSADQKTPVVELESYRLGCDATNMAQVVYEKLQGEAVNRAKFHN